MYRTLFSVAVFAVTALLLPQQVVYAEPSVEITSPNGDESYTEGKAITITWDATDVDKVTLSYEILGELHLIASNIPNEDSYRWTVAVGDLLPGTQQNVEIQIIAYETGEGTARDNSDATFVVRSAGALPEGVDGYDDESLIYGTESPIPYSKWSLHVIDTIAELYGRVNPNGLAADVWFEVSTAPNNPQDFNVPEPVAFPAVRDTLEYSAIVTGLQPATTYSWRLVAENVNGVVYGTTHEFTTAEADPDKDTDDTDTDDTTKLSSTWVHTITPTSVEQPSRTYGAPYFEYMGVQAMLMKTHAADDMIILTAGSGSKLQKIAPIGRLQVDNAWHDIAWNGIWPLGVDGHYMGKVYHILRVDDPLYRTTGKYLAEMYQDLPGCATATCSVAGWRLQEYEL